MLGGSNLVLWQNSATQSAAMTVSRAVASHWDNPATAFGVRARPSHHRTTDQMIIESPPKTVQIGQTTARAASVSSPPAMGLPRPGIRGVVASAAWRHAEPTNEVSQVWSLRKVNWSVTNASQSAGGPWLLRTLASIVLVPACRLASTFVLEIIFQLRLAPKSTGLPLIFN